MDDAPAMPPVLPNDVLTGTLMARRYRIGRVLGVGGMGTVYAAEHTGTGMHVAVKVLRAELANEPDVLSRFHREAKLIASLKHPNIVKVTDFEQPTDEPPFLVMELLEGESLRARIARLGAQEPRVVIALAMQVLAALESAHEMGVVHRDLKPDNVFVVPQPDGSVRAKLLDFGVAHLMDSHEYTRLTKTGVLIGTPSYMAPELLADQRADARSDVYALGVTMYGALAGRLPFRGKSASELMRAVMAGSPEPLRDACPGLPPPLYEIIERAMSLMPDARFGSAREMRAALERVAPTLLATTAVPRRPSLHPPFDRPMSLPPPPSRAATATPAPVSREESPANGDATMTVAMGPSHALDAPAPRPPASPSPPTESMVARAPLRPVATPRAHSEGVSARTLFALAIFAGISVLFALVVAVMK